MTIAVTTEELNNLSEEISKLRLEESEISYKKKQVTERLLQLETKMIELLIMSQIQSYRSPSGLCSISKRMSVKLPKTQEDKLAFYNYLKEIGIYEQMVTVNSMTLNGFYREEFEKAEQEGKEVNIPGIKEVTFIPTLSFRK